MARWPCESNRGNISEHPSFDRNGSYFLDLSTDNWIKPDKQEYLKVTITSQRPFQDKWDFPYVSSVFCLEPSTGEERVVIFSLPVDTFPKLGKKKLMSGTCLKCLSKLLTFNWCTSNQCLRPKGFVVQTVRRCTCFYSLQISCNSAVLTKGFCFMEWDHCRKIHASL